VYVAGRDESKGQDAIQRLKSAHPSSKGRLNFLNVDLSDLSSIKPAAETFMSKEARLDVLFNNAGVNSPPEGSKTAQVRKKLSWQVLVVR
jgi:retinol dehydrogenase-12